MATVARDARAHEVEAMILAARTLVNLLEVADLPAERGLVRRLAARLAERRGGLDA
jgi:hypothetical protein